MNRIKGGFSRRLPSNLPIRQRGFTDHLILNPDHFHSRRTYIHQNPVRAHLTQTPEQYPYSSAHKATNNHAPNLGKPRVHAAKFIATSSPIHR